jgi:hypothetical protein
MSAKWFAAFSPASAFPLPDAERSALGELRQALSSEGESESFLQLSEMHRGNAASRLPRYAAALRPNIGLGVRPDRDPPKLWTSEELYDLEPGTPPRPLMELAMHLDGGANERAAASEAMAGVGALVEVWLGRSAEAWFAETSPLLSKAITEAPFLGFPFYMPILDLRAIKETPGERLGAHLCGATIYLRESVEDHGILLLCNRQPGDRLQQWMERHAKAVQVRAIES